MKVRGKRLFLVTTIDLFERCRLYGKALMVSEAAFLGQVHQLTANFPGPKPKNTFSDDPNVLFVLFGAPNPERWYNPLQFYMDRTVAVAITDPLQKWQVLTAWLNPVESAPGQKKRIIGYWAGISRGGSIDPNWSFNMFISRFVPPLTQLPELCDGNFGQIQSSYRSYRAFKVSQLDNFCPWGGANDLVEIRNHLGKILTDEEISLLLQDLGGADPDFVTGG